MNGLKKLLVTCGFAAMMLLTIESRADEQLFRRTGAQYLADSHRIYDIQRGYITLENGTVWLVNTADLHQIMYWKSGESIEVRPIAASCAYPYEYVFYKATKWGEEARVRIVEIPYTTTFIVGFDIDFLQCRVHLSDGSSWKVDPADRDVIQGYFNNRIWEVRDFVMIGSNQGWHSRLSYAYPQLVINLSTGDYVHAKFHY